MGKKTMKNSEKKPSHKTPVASSKKEQKQQQKKRKSWKKRKEEELEGLLKLGLDWNDAAVQRLKKEMNDVSRQRKLARRLVKVPINPCKESISLISKMFVSARENVPEAVLGLLMGRLMDRFGRSYKRFVYELWEHIWLKVHLRCLQQDAGLAGLSDRGMFEMQPLHLLKLLDGVAVASGERKMKVLVSEFGLQTPCSYPVEHIVAELVEKMAKAFAEVAPEDARAVFAEVAHQDAMAHAIRGMSLAK